MKTFEVKDKFMEDPRAWLEQQAEACELHYLLAYADDGVIWGKFDEQYKLTLSGEVIDAVKVELRADTLQQARVFDTEGELLIWKAANSFKARQISNEENVNAEYVDEDFILWGTETKRRGVFTLLTDGEQGLLHAPPATKDQGKEKRLALVVRHYIGYDDENSIDGLQKEGQACVILSRLVDFKQVQGEKE
ncbi:MAG: type III-D CRISPR-associated protein Csx19 [bacterium]